MAAVAPGVGVPRTVISPAGESSFGSLWRDLHPRAAGGSAPRGRTHPGRVEPRRLQRMGCGWPGSGGERGLGWGDPGGVGFSGRIVTKRTREPSPRCSSWAAHHPRVRL
ncbi:hypothetical protein T484DRAFT_1939681 [Baffinella frigidus]|nr:hypothetical protein T484DRAFT_1939681 [Cryptophyta sp. CCMP2293]